jgi:hypothetical protein
VLAKHIAGGVALVLVTALAYVWVESRRLDRTHSAMVADLLSAADGACGERISATAYEGLPPPVQRYLARVIPEGSQRARHVRITQSGVFRTRDQPERWQDFHAVQHVSTTPPGFVWDATIRMGPLFSVRVLDAYREGSGRLLARLLGAFPVADESGPEVDSGELMRYLAEAVWYPTALVPDDRLSWQPLDDRSAVAVLKDGGQEVSMTFHFDEDGLVSAVEGERFRAENGRYRKLPWVGYHSSYELRDGFYVPTEARVAWRLPEGDSEYFRGRIQGVEYGP